MFFHSLASSIYRDLFLLFFPLNVQLTHLLHTGREKLDLGEVRIKVVLEADGTQVEDPEYFCTLPENTVFLLLRQGEHWYPAGVEVLRQGSYALPRRSVRELLEFSLICSSDYYVSAYCPKSTLSFER